MHYSGKGCFEFLESMHYCIGILKIHHYYRTREKNPLKKMQSVIAVACKLIRIFYTILTKGIDYDGQKMLRDIVRPGMQSAA